jgi:trans-aconitate 2-methyltransferase
MLRTFAQSLHRNGDGRRTIDDRLELVLADFQSLPFRDAFDIIFSNAAFHWAPDHESMFSSIFGALKRKGRLIAQCGGGANLAGIREREQILIRDKMFARYFRDWEPPWNYADVPTTVTRLKEVGFADSEVWLQPAPLQMADAASFRAFAETVVERTQVQMLPDRNLRELYLDRFVDLAAGGYVFDYVRLNINAQKG